MSNIKIGVITSLAILILIVVMASLGIWDQSRKCSAKARMIGVEFQFTRLTGCMINLGGKWQPLDWQRRL